jgi:hypothetical protein
MELGEDTELEPGTMVKIVELTTVLMVPEVEVEFAKEELTSIPVPQEYWSRLRVEDYS